MCVNISSICFASAPEYTNKDAENIVPERLLVSILSALKSIHDCCETLYALQHRSDWYLCAGTCKNRERKRFIHVALHRLRQDTVGISASDDPKVLLLKMRKFKQQINSYAASQFSLQKLEDMCNKSCAMCTFLCAMCEADRQRIPYAQHHAWSDTCNMLNLQDISVDCDIAKPKKLWQKAIVSMAVAWRKHLREEISAIC